MTNLRPIYRDVEDWGILAEETFYDYTDDENPIEYVEVLIGTLHFEHIDLAQHYSETRTPIIRWISKRQYELLKRHSGTIIW